MKKKELAVLSRNAVKLHRDLDGIANMKKLPAVLVVIDTDHELNAVKEANKLNIPIVAIVDTNGDPSMIQYPVAANDDAVKSIQIITDLFADAILIAKEIYQKRVIEERDAKEAAAKKAADEKALEILKGEIESLKHLLNASEIELGLEAFDSASRGAAPSQLVTLGVISLPLAGLIDVEAECAKLEKQLKDIDKWLAGVRGRLSNEKFVNSAPAQVVADARKQLEELEARKTQTEAILAGLKA